MNQVCMYTGFAGKFFVNYDNHMKGEWLEKFGKSLLNALPHGSGIDADWNITLSPCDNVPVVGHNGAIIAHTSGHSVVCSNDYHAMDHGGAYAGWIGGYTLTFWLDDELTPVSQLYPYPTLAVIHCELTFVEDIDALQEATDKEYGVSDEDEEFFGVDWQGNKEYLEELLPSCLSDWFKNTENWR